VRVAVTGSSGLIGSALVRSLRGDGHDVVRVVRSGSSEDGPTVRWDLDARTIDAAGLDGIDAAVHLAGEGIAEKRWTEQQKRRILESRTVSTALLAETLAAMARPPRVLLSGSGVHAYGDRGDEVLTETSSTGSLFLSEVCTGWEAAALPAVDAGIRTAFLRTTMVLDRDGGALPRLVRLFKLGLGGRLGSGRQWMPWISLADEVGAIRFLLDHDVAGPVNLAAPGSVTNAEFTKALGKALRRPAVLPVPAFAPSLLVGRELAHELLFTSQRAEPRVLEDAGYAFAHPEIGGALRAVLSRG
jgi:hypothetical protein